MATHSVGRPRLFSAALTKEATLVSLPDNKLEISGGKRQETSAANMDLLRRFYETIVGKYSVNAARESGADVGV